MLVDCTATFCGTVSSKQWFNNGLTVHGSTLGTFGNIFLTGSNGKRSLLKFCNVQPHYVEFASLLAYFQCNLIGDIDFTLSSQL